LDYGDADQPACAEASGDEGDAEAGGAGALQAGRFRECHGDGTGRKGRGYGADVLPALPDEGSGVIRRLRDAAGMARGSASATASVGESVRRCAGECRQLPARPGNCASGRTGPGGTDRWRACSGPPTSSAGILRKSDHGVRPRAIRGRAGYRPKGGDSGSNASGDSCCGGGELGPQRLHRRRRPDRRGQRESGALRPRAVALRRRRDLRRRVGRRLTVLNPQRGRRLQLSRRTPRRACRGSHTLVRNGRVTGALTRYCRTRLGGSPLPGNKGDQLEIQMQSRMRGAAARLPN
jgi:hypothetical protein